MTSPRVPGPQDVVYFNLKIPVSKATVDFVQPLHVQVLMCSFTSVVFHYLPQPAPTPHTHTVCIMLE